MSAFQHVTTLMSFVYALALSHLLTRIANLVAAHERVRFSGLLVLEMANAIVLVLSGWLSVWDERSIGAWNLSLIGIDFLYATSVYFVCIMAGPQVVDHSPVDLEEFFWSNRPYFYGALVVCGVFALLANYVSLSASGDHLFVKESMTVPPMLVPPIIALFYRVRWVQWLAGLSFLAMMIGYTIIFSSTLQ